MDSAANIGTNTGLQEFVTNSGYNGPNAGPEATSSVGTANVTVASASAGTPAGTISVTVATTGTSATGANVPPFVALYYIMKVTGVNYTGI
jgi:microcystin-dependent protein